MGKPCQTELTTLSPDDLRKLFIKIYVAVNGEIAPELLTINYTLVHQLFSKGGFTHVVDGHDRLAFLIGSHENFSFYPVEPAVSANYFAIVPEGATFRVAAT